MFSVKNDKKLFFSLLCFFCVVCRQKQSAAVYVQRHHLGLPFLKAGGVTSVFISLDYLCAATESTHYLHRIYGVCVDRKEAGGAHTAGVKLQITGEESKSQSFNVLL